MAYPIPEIIQPLLKEFTASVQQQLPGFLNKMVIKLSNDQK